MKIYKILKGQLITLLVFCCLFWLVILIKTLDEYEPSNFSIFLIFFIPFILVFYVIGWLNYKKSSLMKNSIYCIECGSNNNNSFEYCNKCGNKLLNNK